jgi:hypothetical protein
VNDLAPLLFAFGLAVFSIIAFKAGKKGVGFTFGIISILVFIGWLASGPGFAILDFDPGNVDVPDNIPIPGGGNK